GNFSTRNPIFTYAQWEELQKRTEPFSGILAWSTTRFNLANGGETRYAEGMYVSGGFFQVLGVTPLIGRTFTPEDDRPGCGARGAVISHSFWQRELAGDPNPTSRTISLDRKTFPVLGVTPASFFGVEVGRQFDVAIPLCSDKYLARDGQGRAPNRTAWWLAAIGRLKPGWTITRANAYILCQAPAIMQSTVPATYRPDMVKR